MILSLLAAVALSASPTSPWLGEDKAMHFSVGLAAGAGTFALTSAYLPKYVNPWLAGGTVTLTLGLGKELFDLRPGGSGFSVPDLLFTLAGGAVGMGLSYVAAYLLAQRRAL